MRTLRTDEPIFGTIEDVTGETDGPGYLVIRHAGTEKEIEIIQEGNRYSWRHAGFFDDLEIGDDEGELLIQPPADPAEFVAKLKGHDTVSERLPAGATDCPGFISEYYEYLEETAMNSQPELNFAAALSMVATIGSITV